MRHENYHLSQKTETRFSFAVTTMVLAIVLSIITARPALPEGPADDRTAVITCGVAADMRRQIISGGLEHLFDGLMESGRHMVQVFASETTGEWIALQVGTDGAGCIVANGWNYEPRTPNT